MKRTVLFIAALITACVAAQAQLLYRITGGGLKAPSYVVGTYHLAPPAFADSITGLKKAIDEVAQVYGELDMAVMLQPANVNKVRQAMDMTDGTTLDKLLSPDEMNRLNALMKELFGADLTHPVLAQQMNKLSPQAMVTQLTMLMFLKRTPNFDASSQLDSHIQTLARDKKKKVGGLETIDDQIKALYKENRIVDNSNPIAEWCRSNVMVRTDANGNIAPDKKNSDPRNRIDAWAAEIDAFVTLREQMDNYRALIGG